MPEEVELQEVGLEAVESAASRRKLQNRLNQRASRKSLISNNYHLSLSLPPPFLFLFVIFFFISEPNADKFIGKRRKEQLQQQRKGEGRVSKWVFYIDPRTEERQANDRRQQQQDERQQQNGSDIAVVSRSLGSNTKYYDPGFPDIFLSKEHRDRAFRFFCTMTREDRTVFFRRLYDVVSENVAKYTLDSQLLLSVMQFNVMRASMANATAIGIIWEQLIEDDAISPFNHGIVLPVLLPAPSGAINAAAGDGNELVYLPPCLQPTALQRQVVHHPWIDLCPQPSLRDALLRRLDDVDEDEFCHHLFLQSSDADEDGMIGMVIWGEPFDTAAYEISESMLRKWPWLVKECPDIVKTTNYWRKERGEERLKIP